MSCQTESIGVTMPKLIIPRTERGMVMLSVDTPEATNENTTTSYANWRTSPRLAGDCRLPSEPFSTDSDVSFPGSIPSAIPFSQSSTRFDGTDPINDPFPYPWLDSTESHPRAHNTIPCSSMPCVEALAQHLGHPSIALAANSVDSLTMCSVHGGSTDGSDGLTSQQALGQAWTEHMPPSQDYATAPLGLRSSFYDTTQGQNTAFGSASCLYDPSGLSYHGFSGEPVAVGHREQYDPAIVSAPYQSPQIVVPSQLSPTDDYTVQHYSDYSSPDLSGGNISDSFKSSTTSLSCVSLEPPSPYSAYGTHSDDDQRPVVRPARSSRLLSWATSPIRVRKSPPKRSQRSRQPQFSYENFNMKIVLENGLATDTEGNVHVVKPSATTKLHCCKFVDSLGNRCDGKFERSEHLKRHQGKHSERRDFPCPLPGCDKEIQRGDNAGDHFKTHLKGPRKGQRNKHHQWPLLKELLLETYPKKVAEKAVKNIERWIVDNDEGANQRLWL